MLNTFHISVPVVPVPIDGEWGMMREANGDRRKAQYISHKRPRRA